MNCRHFDIGQMAVDLYLLWLSKGSKAGLWMMEGLLAEFDGLENEQLTFRIAIRIGSFLVCMLPLTPDWETPEMKIEDFVRAGRDIIVHAWNKDRAWFENSELACLFSRAA